MERVMSCSRWIAGFALAMLALGFLSPTLAHAKKLNVVTSTTDMAALTQEVGGDKVNVDSIAKGYQDPHFVEAKPSFLLKLRQADLLISVGLQLEIGWLPPLITQSGNPRIQVGAGGYLDASQFAQILEIPQGTVTRAEGDVHPLGNPHYWLDPDNGRRIAKGIAGKLGDRDPGDAADFRNLFQDVDKRLSAAEQKWDVEMKPYRGRKVVTYHRSFPNFAQHFGLDVIGYVEPRPGIPPTPSHTLELIQLMKRENAKVVLVEPYFDLKTPQSIGRATGAQVIVYLPSVGGEKQVTNYFELFDYDINLLTKAFQAAQYETHGNSSISAGAIFSQSDTDWHSRVPRSTRGGTRRDLCRFGARTDSGPWCNHRHSRRIESAWRRRVLAKPGFYLAGGCDICLRPHAARTYSARGLHRNCVCRGLGNGYSRNEQGNWRDRAPERHAGWQYSRGIDA